MVDDLIRRQAAIDAIEKTYGSIAYQEDGFTRSDAIDILKSLPSAQTKRNPGKWIEHHEPYTWMGYTYWTCSECGFGEDDNKVRSNYCPNCGADMRGEPDGGKNESETVPKLSTLRLQSDDR